ncbi:MAG: (Fe-S)-binding protein [Candidatus Brocadiaceae bacterium]|nr:(Fe-S)-binding protein [Candidatus Brocadiaceae bacterium]
MTTDWKDEVSKCSKCGKCHTVCPVFLETGDESTVARGRISLAEALRDKQIVYTDKLRDYVYSCKKCMRCQTICPSGVDYEVIISTMLRGVAENMGIPLLPKMIFRYILPRRILFDLMLKVSSKIQWLIPMKRRGQMRHLPLLFMGKRWIPTLAKKTALQKLRQPRKLKNPKMRVGLFTGCLINYIYVDIAEAVIDVLNRMNIEVVVPQGQLCCGTPSSTMGDYKSSKKLADVNKEVFESQNLDAIVSACATCTKSIKKDYLRTLGPSWQQMSDKIYDISEFIEKYCGDDYKAKPIDGKVTYHDPCHLLWVRGISDQPRNVLKKSSDFVEMDQAGSCCGGGGIFTIIHYDLTLKMLERKVSSIERSGADTVATNCPGCIMQIADGFAGKDSKIKTTHSIQILQKALANGDVDKGNWKL